MVLTGKTQPDARDMASNNDKDQCSPEFKDKCVQEKAALAGSLPSWAAACDGQFDSETIAQCKAASSGPDSRFQQCTATPMISPASSSCMRSLDNPPTFSVYDDIVLDKVYRAAYANCEVGAGSDRSLQRSHAG